MWGQCIDLPLDSAPWLHAVAGPQTIAHVQSIFIDVYGLNHGELQYQEMKNHTGPMVNQLKK